MRNTQKMQEYKRYEGNPRIKKKREKNALIEDSKNQSKNSARC